MWVKTTTFVDQWESTIEDEDELMFEQKEIEDAVKLYVFNNGELPKELVFIDELTGREILLNMRDYYV